MIKRAALVALVSTALVGPGLVHLQAQDAATEETLPPEMTRVSGRLVDAGGNPVSGGAAYFVFQSRLNEIPHEGGLEKAKAMAEAAVAVDEGGSISLTIKPGNFALVYDPAADTSNLAPGPESMANTKRLTPDQVQAKIAAIKENASRGLPIKEGKLGEGFVIENRFVRPPVSNFGDLQLQSTGTVTIAAVNEASQPVDFPVTLRLRGKNGDIMEPHTPSISEKGRYSFHDIMPQSYQVFALGSRPRPGAGDDITTPVITNDSFIYTGEPLEHTVTVKPGAPGGSDPAPPHTPAAR